MKSKNKNIHFIRTYSPNPTQSKYVANLYAVLVYGDDDISDEECDDDATVRMLNTTRNETEP